MTTKYHDHDFLKSRENVIIIVENPFIEIGLFILEFCHDQKPAETLLVFKMLFCGSKRLRYA